MTNSFPQVANFTIIAHFLSPTGKLEKALHKTSKDTFTAEHPLIGYPKLLPHSKINSYQDKSIFLTISIKTTTFPETCKKITGYVGLINEGTTCYMNSLLQTLFLITAFRKAIYSIPISDSDEGKIPKALGKLFAALQLSEKPLSTQDLLRSFGWARDQWHEQQDVQEFSYKFSDTLEKSMNGTPAQGTYTQLFKGQLLQKIKCVNVLHESKTLEDFIDLQLDVKGCDNIYSSFDKYVEPVILNGETQYEADGHGKQDAEKCVKFQKLPSVLQIQLKRFEYNSSRGMMTKVNERFEFYPEVDLNPYVVLQSEFNKYRLFSILAHSGTLGKGHYSSFISPGLDHVWYQFNDNTVDKALPTQAVEANWGGEIEDISISGIGNIVYGKKKCDTSAYMLVYIRISEKNTVLPYISDLAIPPKLKQAETKTENKPRETRRTTRSACYNIAFATKETIIGWEGPGIASFCDKNSFLIFQARKNVKFQEFIDTKLAYISDAKLWSFTPGPVNWNFKEINSQDTLSQHSITEDINTAVFIETKHKVFIGSLGCWSWNEQESCAINGKQDHGKILVLIKKFENARTKIIGSEWVVDKSVSELRKRLIDKYIEIGADGWICLERSDSEEVRIEEMYSFFQMKKKKVAGEKIVYLGNGDVIVVGNEPVDACTMIRSVYNSVTIEVVYHDNLSFFEFKSFSKRLFEKHLLGTNFTITLNLSSSQFEVMQKIQSIIQIPGLDVHCIQLLDTSYKPISPHNFFISKILLNNRLYFDILDYNALDDETHQTIVEFSQDFTPLQKIVVVTQNACKVEKLLESLGKQYEIFLFRYQQRSILKILAPDDEVSQLAPGIILGIREGAEKVGNKERVIKS